MANSGSTLGQLSAGRRERLKEHYKVNDVMNSVSMEKYYGFASLTLAKALEKHEKLYAVEHVQDWPSARARWNDVDECYCFWKRYTQLILGVIPKHNYYNSPRYMAERRSTEAGIASCLAAVEKVVATMDNDCAIREAERERQLAELKRREAERRAKEEKERLRREAAARAVMAAEAERQRKQQAEEREEARRRQEESRKQQELEEDLEDAIEDDDVAPQPPAMTTTTTTTEFSKGDKVEYVNRDGRWIDAVVARVHYDDSPPYYTISIVGESREVQTVSDKLRKKRTVVPSYYPSVEEQPNLPSYDDLAPPPNYGDVPQPSPPPSSLPSYQSAPPPPGALDVDLLPSPLVTPPSKPPPLSKLSGREIKDAVTSEWRKINARVESLPTYQGRVRDARGLNSTNGCAVIAPLTCYQHITQGTTNEDVVKLIDTVVPPILAHIRAKLRLKDGAFIIPADVHDYLYDQGAISRDMFEGVYGGSVVDDGHVGNLVQALKGIPATKRAAAAFFYKEHVTAILRVPVANARFEYHFVDSMPGSRGGATRTICPDSSALQTYIKYFGVNKLDVKAIEAPWSDLQAEFDPRVFQGFVWQFDPTTNKAASLKH